MSKDTKMQFTMRMNFEHLNSNSQKNTLMSYRLAQNKDFRDKNMNYEI